MQAKHRMPLSMKNGANQLLNRSKIYKDDLKKLEKIPEAASLDESASVQNSDLASATAQDRFNDEKPDQLVSMSISEMEN